MLETAIGAAPRRRKKWVERGRRRRLRIRWNRRWVIGGGTIALLVIAGLLIAFGPRPAPRADPAAARVELAKSVTLFQAGNISGARVHALAAVKADPGWGLSHAMLGRLYLASDDGDNAEAELTRAQDAGFDPARLHHLLADAWLLQGDPDRSIAEAARAAPRYAGYAQRVRARALAAQGDFGGAQRVLGALIDQAPGDSIAWSDLARIRYQAGDAAGAISAAARALTLDHANTDATVLRGELVRDQFGLTASLPWFEAALKRDPGNHDALIDYAATLGDSGHYEDMLAATRRALVARPGSAQAYYLQAVLAARASKFDLARGLMQRTGDALGGMPGALLLGGMLDYQAGGYEQAIEKWRELVGTQPMNITARRLLGAALLRSGDANGALDVLRPVALRDDADSYTLSLVARAFEHGGGRDWAGKFLDRASIPADKAPAPFGSDDSLAILDNAVEQAPDDPQAAVGYIRGLIDAGRKGAALGVAQHLANASLGAPAARVLVGDILMDSSRTADAARAFARAADLRFDEPTMLRLVDALDRSGRRREAARALALFLAQNPQDIAARRLAAHWQIAGGEWEAAIDSLESLRGELGNRDAALLAELAAAYLGADDADTARHYAAAAYRLAPLNPGAIDAYGWALHLAGDNRGARQLLRKAVSIAPGHVGLRAHLAAIEAAHR